MTEREEEVGMNFLEVESVPLELEFNPSLSISRSSQKVIMVRLKSSGSETRKTLGEEAPKAYHTSNM